MSSPFPNPWESPPEFFKQEFKGGSSGECECPNCKPGAGGKSKELPEGYRTEAELIEKREDGRKKLQIEWEQANKTYRALMVWDPDSIMRISRKLQNATTPDLNGMSPMEKAFILALAGTALKHLAQDSLETNFEMILETARKQQAESGGDAK